MKADRGMLPQSCIALMISLVVAGSARADGGAILSSQTTSGYRITVFAEPSPLRVGPADFSVLVQDEETDRALMEPEIFVEFESLAERRSIGPLHAERGSATNQLSRSVEISLPNPGHWRAAVRVNGPRGMVATTTLFDVKPPMPRWMRYLGWILWPFAVMAIYVALGSRRSRRQPDSRVGGR